MGCGRGWPWTPKGSLETPYQTLSRPWDSLGSSYDTLYPMGKALDPHTTPPVPGESLGSSYDTLLPPGESLGKPYYYPSIWAKHWMPLPHWGLKAAPEGAGAITSFLQHPAITPSAKQFLSFFNSSQTKNVETNNCLTSVTHVKCGVRSSLCWKVWNISGPT